MNRSAKGILPARVREAERAQSSGSFASGALWGMAFCAVGGLILLVAGAVIAYYSPDPNALILPLGFGAMVLSCLLGGLGVGLKCDSAILPCSLLCGCIYIGLGLLLGLFFSGELRQTLSLGLSLGASLGIRAGLVALFCASAVLTAQIKGKIAARPRRHR